MKLFPFLFSLLLLGYLVTDFVGQSNAANETSVSNATSSISIPKRFNDELLDIEKVWRTLKAEQNQPKSTETVEKDKPKNQHMLTLGEQEYALLGIFNDPQAPFVLLKDATGNMIKLRKGDKLDENAELVAMQSDKIIFKQDNQSIEFKLFERKTNAPN